jgi:hypothetical protein
MWPLGSRNLARILEHQMQMSCDEVAGGARCTPSCRSTTRRVVYRVAPSCRVIASASLAHVQSITQFSTVALYYSDESARLAGHDYAACLRILQVPRYM